MVVYGTVCSSPLTSPPSAPSFLLPSQLLFIAQLSHSHLSRSHSCRSIAHQEQFDYALVESSGISEPLPVAETFTFEDNGTSLSQAGNTDVLARTYAWARDGAWAGRGKRW